MVGHMQAGSSPKFGVASVKEMQVKARDCVRHMYRHALARIYRFVCTSTKAQKLITKQHLSHFVRSNPYKRSLSQRQTPIPETSKNNASYALSRRRRRFAKEKNPKVERYMSNPILLIPMYEAAGCLMSHALDRKKAMQTRSAHVAPVMVSLLSFVE